MINFLDPPPPPPLHCLCSLKQKKETTVCGIPGTFGRPIVLSFFFKLRRAVHYVPEKSLVSCSTKIENVLYLVMLIAKLLGDA